MRGARRANLRTALDMSGRLGRGEWIGRHCLTGNRFYPVRDAQTRGPNAHPRMSCRPTVRRDLASALRCMGRPEPAPQPRTIWPPRRVLATTELQYTPEQLDMMRAVKRRL